MGRAMGLGKVLTGDTVFKRKYRWMFKIEQVSGDASDGPQYVNALPPTKAARPNLTFKEIEANHISETIYFPGKPDWKPVSITLYDLCMQQGHPVWAWINSYYKPDQENNNLGFALTGNPISFGSLLSPIAGTVGGTGITQAPIKKNATLELYDGCGDVLETWTYENAWPQIIEFGELDMGQSEVVTCELTLRYDRAYIKS